MGALEKILGNLAPCGIDDLAGLVRTRLKRVPAGPARRVHRRDRPDHDIAMT
ncbi:hypothetical protein ACH4HG_40850 [Streptomyces coeruleorubidus]|uniref:hypothetical protein n=1 Tax=Streptomyces coeruleorubidus TaxID=116188 RepID=UPI0037A84EE7